uniref:Serpin domain-containing protein n=1 Tax=Gouania willdenowi TaxID=441366 RepID=A0A8C5ECZ7_GOUWI
RKPALMERDGINPTLVKLIFDSFVESTRLDTLGRNEVEVKLLRIKMEETCDLKDVLTMHSDELERLLLLLEVNKEETEATAATAAVINERAVIIHTMFFTDHPFLFFIQHKPTKMLLLAGGCCSPQSTLNNCETA